MKQLIEQYQTSIYRTSGTAQRSPAEVGGQGEQAGVAARG
jgi:hypothetical protein